MGVIKLNGKEYGGGEENDVVDELGILFPRIDLDKEFSELAEIMGEN